MWEQPGKQNESGPFVGRRYTGSSECQGNENNGMPGDQYCGKCMRMISIWKEENYQ